MKRILSLALTLLMLLSTVAFAEIDYTEWGVSLPYVPEGETATLKIVVPQDGNNFNSDDVWFWKWAGTAMNIRFDVQQIASSAFAEKLNLMFASGELPDIIFGWGLSTAEVVKYGVNEQQIVAISDYMTEELMPNLYQWSQKVDFSNCYASDGKMYVFPYIDRIPYNGGNGHPIYINTDWMKELGFEMPETAEDVLEILRAMKADKPNSIPMGSGVESVPLMQHFLNAFGFQSRDQYGTDPTYYKNEKLVIPAATKEFKPFLEYMHTLYEEELISPDFFTIDRNTDFANAAIESYGMWPYPMAQVSQDLTTVQKYFAVQTLLSDYNDVYCCPLPSYVIPGTAFISASSENIELALKFMDFWYSDLGIVYGWAGPMAGTEDTLDMVGGWYVDDDSKIHWVDVENGKFTSSYTYTIGVIAPCSAARFNNASMLSLDITKYSRDGSYMKFAGVEPKTETRRFDAIDEVGPYTTYELNTIHYADKSVNIAYVYFDEATANKVLDLKTVISTYAKSEIAKFITGARSLDEFDDYLSEINALGVEEYIQYYNDVL